MNSQSRLFRSNSTKEAQTSTSQEHNGHLCRGKQSLCREVYSTGSRSRIKQTNHAEGKRLGNTRDIDEQKQADEFGEVGA